MKEISNQWIDNVFNITSLRIDKWYIPTWMVVPIWTWSAKILISTMVNMIGVNNKNKAEKNEHDELHHWIWHFMTRQKRDISHPMVQSGISVWTKMSGLEICSNLLALIIVMKTMIPDINVCQNLSKDKSVTVENDSFGNNIFVLENPWPESKIVKIQLKRKEKYSPIVLVLVVKEWNQLEYYNILCIISNNAKQICHKFQWWNRRHYQDLLTSLLRSQHATAKQQWSIHDKNKSEMKIFI